MSLTELQRINERVERLEQRLRWQTRSVVGVGVLGLAASLLIGQMPSKRIVEAEKFILRGPQGQELANLDGLGTGAGLVLYDSQHRARVALTTHDDAAPSVLVYDSNLKGAAVIGIENNNPYVSLHDEQDRSRAELGLVDQNPFIRMRDSNSKIRIAVAMNQGTPLVSVVGPDPKKGGVILGEDEKGGHVLITGPDGKSKGVMR